MTCPAYTVFTLSIFIAAWFLVYNCGAVSDFHLPNTFVDVQGMFDFASCTAPPLRIEWVDNLLSTEWITDKMSWFDIGGSVKSSIEHESSFPWTLPNCFNKIAASKGPFLLADGPNQ